MGLRPNARAAAAAAAFAFLAPVALAQTMYRWVDANGTTHYSSTPPPAGQGRQVRELAQPASSPPAKAGAAAPSTWQEKELEFRRRRLEAEMTNAAEERRVAAAKRQAGERREACIAARQDLEALQGGVPVYSLDQNGERVYIEDAKRGAAIEAAKRDMARYCN